MEIVRLKLTLKFKNKYSKFPSIEEILTWYPIIKREFPEDEKDFGEWCYND